MKATVFQYSTVFPFIGLAQFILLFLFLALMKSFLRACLPLYPSDFSRLLVLSLTDFWISSPHFCAKTLAGQLSSLLSPIFISANDLLTLSLEVYHYVLQFGCFREVDILSRLSQQCLLVSIFEIVAPPPFAIPTMKARSSSLTSFSLPIFQLWMS